MCLGAGRWQSQSLLLKDGGAQLQELLLLASSVQQNDLLLLLEPHPESDRVHRVVWETEAIVDKEESTAAPPVVVWYLFSLKERLSSDDPKGVLLARHEAEALVVHHV